MKKVVIGDCELYLGDCMDILPNLPLTVSLSALKKTKLILRLHKIELLQSNAEVSGAGTVSAGLPG